MGHERTIEAMREARHGLPASQRPSERRRQRNVRRRRVLALLVFVVVVVAVLVVVARMTGGESGGGDFAGTWQKRGSSGRIVIEHVEGDRYAVTVPNVKSKLEATRSGDRLTVVDALGVENLTITFTVEDGGKVLVETFPKGEPDRLDRVE